MGNEAAFLWVSRKAVAHSSAVTSDVLARLDDRLWRLVSTLSEVPLVAEHLLRHEAVGFRSGLAFVTGVVALRSASSSIVGELVARAESDAQLVSPLASALAWTPYEQVGPCVEGLLAARSPVASQLGLMASVAHRVDPGPALDKAIESEVPRLQACAFETIGRLGLQRLRPRLRQFLEHEDTPPRFWAAWSTVRLGDRAAIPVLGRFAAAGGLFAQPACDIALRALETDHAIRAHGRLLSITGNKRLAAFAAGVVGVPVLGDWLLDVMGFEAVARSAAAAFCLLTGRDLRRDDLDSETPPSVLTEVADAAVAGAAVTELGGVFNGGEADDELAWPDVPRLRKWWVANRHEFVPGTRYLAGRPVNRLQLAEVLRTGNQHQRAAAALEIALLDTDAPLLDVTAPAHQITRRISESSDSGSFAV